MDMGSVKVQSWKPSTGLVNGVHEILEPTSDVFARWSRGSFTACPCLLWCVCVCFCWPVHPHMRSQCGVAEVETRSRSARPRRWQGFPPSTATDDSFKWHSFRGNWSSSSSLEVLTHGVTFQIPAQPREGDLSAFETGSTTFVSLPLINKRSWMITLFQRHYRQLIKVLGRS